jgi:hypothetical protein
MSYRTPDVADRAAKQGPEHDRSSHGVARNVVGLATPSAPEVPTRLSGVA